MTNELAIRKAVFAALFENVTHDGEFVGIYDAFELPDGVSYPYILISAQTSSQRVTKGRRPMDATLVIDIVTGFPTPVGREPADEIQEQVNDLLNPDDRTDLDTTLNGFIIGDINLRSARDISDKSDVYYVYRKLLLYSLIITKI